MFGSGTEVWKSVWVEGESEERCGEVKEKVRGEVWRVREEVKEGRDMGVWGNVFSCGEDMGESVERSERKGEGRWRSVGEVKKSGGGGRKVGGVEKYGEMREGRGR